tara:strand:- start:125 stop:301 length:177 start_codon:yes stop_codon:yes gene_type:complete
MENTILLIAIMTISSLSCVCVCLNGYKIHKYLKTRENDMGKELLERNYTNVDDETADI